MLQKKDLTLGNFFGIWVQAKNKLNQINSVLRNANVDNMNTRQEQLMDYKKFVSGNSLLFFSICTV